MTIFDHVFILAESDDIAAILGVYAYGNTIFFILETILFCQQMAGRKSRNVASNSPFEVLGQPVITSNHPVEHTETKNLINNVTFCSVCQFVLS